MSVAEVVTLPALEQARLVRDRVISARELTHAYLARIEVDDAGLGAFITVAEQSAREAADAVDSSSDQARGVPLLGVPMSVKDTLDVAGLPTTNGVVGVMHGPATLDDPVVARARRAGGIVVGKTTTPALGLGCVSEPEGYPPSRNPWDPSRTSGGSSGGAAASVAASMCGFALGADGSGSIRVPAAWCGLVGLKPSRGRVSPADGGTAVATSGGITRDVRDAAALLDALAAGTNNDHARRGGFLDGLSRPSPPRRVGYAFGGRRVQPAIHAAVLRVVDVLAGRGHAVEEFELDLPWASLIVDSLPFVQGIPEVAADLRSRPENDRLDPLVTRLIEYVDGVPRDLFGVHERRLRDLAGSVLQRTARVDVLLTPTTGLGPPRVGQHKFLSVPELLAAWEEYVPFTGMWNWTGQPALTVPAGLDEDGLPIGVQLVGPVDGEAIILALALEIEQTLGRLSCPTPRSTNPESQSAIHLSARR